MEIFLHKTFKKKYRKLQPNEKKKFKERGNLFLKNPFHPILNNHSLHGKYTGYNSINITGDLRAIFKLIGPNMVLFIDIDTHTNLYF